VKVIRERRLFIHIREAITLYLEPDEKDHGYSKDAEELEIAL
jgi:hypothetical protein